MDKSRFSERWKLRTMRAWIVARATSTFKASTTDENYERCEASELNASHSYISASATDERTIKITNDARSGATVARPRRQRASTNTTNDARPTRIAGEFQNRLASATDENYERCEGRESSEAGKRLHASATDENCERCERVTSKM